MAYLRAHDVAVALQLCLSPGLSYRALAEAVGLSQGETRNAVQRLVAARRPAVCQPRTQPRL